MPVLLLYDPLLPVNEKPVGRMSRTSIPVAVWGEVAAFVGSTQIYVLDVSDHALQRARDWVERRSLHDRVTIVDARKNPVEAVVAGTGGGVDVALEISGHPDGINNAIQMVRPAGHVVNLGLPRGDAVTIERFSKNFIFKGLTMHAVVGREMFRTWHQMLDLLKNGLDIRHFITAEMPLESFAEGVERFGRGEEQKVVLYPGERA